MSRIRFATAREVFQAFPSAGDDLEAQPSDDPPLVYMASLLGSPTPEDAIAFCAYVLPRREAVWWAAQCLRTLIPSPASEEQAALQAAEAWVREPEEHRRLAAMHLGKQGDRAAPTTWVALAAAWSGGSMLNAGQGVAPAPADLTAKAARIAVLTALARIGPRERAACLKTCLENGIRLADESREQRVG